MFGRMCGTSSIEHLILYRTSGTKAQHSCQMDWSTAHAIPHNHVLIASGIFSCLDMPVHVLLSSCLPQLICVATLLLQGLGDPVPMLHINHQLQDQGPTPSSPSTARYGRRANIPSTINESEPLTPSRAAPTTPSLQRTPSNKSPGRGRPAPIKPPGGLPGQGALTSPKGLPPNGTHGVDDGLSSVLQVRNVHQHVPHYFACAAHALYALLA